MKSKIFKQELYNKLYNHEVETGYESIPEIYLNELIRTNKEIKIIKYVSEFFIENYTNISIIEKLLKVLSHLKFKKYSIPIYSNI